MKTFVAIVCFLVVTVYPLYSEGNLDGKDWLEKLSETARNVMEDPKQLGPGLKDVVGALSEMLFHKEPKAKKASHTNEQPADKYKPEEAPVKDANAPLTADNLFNLLAEIQQIYGDFNEGKKLNYNKVTKLAIRFLDFIVNNPEMDTFIIEMASKFEYGPMTKPVIKSTLESAIGGYRNLRKMSGLGEMVEVITKYVPLDTFADKSYLSNMFNSYATLVLGQDVYRTYKPLVDSIIELVSVSANHLREARLGDFTKSKSQFYVNKFNEYIMQIPLREVISAFETYSSSLNSLNGLEKDMVSGEVVKSVGTSKEHVQNLIARFEKADAETKLEYTQFDSKFSQDVGAVFAKLKGLAKDLTVVANKVQDRKLKEFAQKIQGEVKRWTLLKEIHAKAANIKNVEDWKSLINKMAEFTNGVTQFEKVSKAVRGVYEQTNRILLSKGINLNAFKTEL